MIELLSLLVAGYTALSLGGLPFAILADRSRLKDVIPSIGLTAPLVGLFEVGVSWIWSFGAGGGPGLSNVLFLLMTGLGYCALIVGRRVRISTLSPKRLGSCSVSLRTLVLIGGVMTVALPSLDGVKNSSYPARVGPDAVAYAVSARVLGYSNSFDGLRKSIEESSSMNLTTLLDNSVPRVYSIPSFTDQLAAEVLLGAKRWTTAGLFASMLQFAPYSSAFAIMNSIIVLCVLLTSLVVAEFVYRCSKSTTWAIVFGLAMSWSPSIAIAYYDGFIAQIIALPFAAILAISIVQFHEPESNSTHLMRWIVPIASITAIAMYYLDLALFLAPVCLALLLVGVLSQASHRHWQRDLRAIFKHCFLAVIVTLPLALRAPQLILARLSQTRGNAYWQPSWMSVPELFGLIPGAYTTDQVVKAAQLQHPITLTSTSVIFWTMSCLGLILAMRIGRHSLQAVRLLGALAITIFVVLEQTELRQLNNYQFVKSVSYSLPLFLICLGRILGPHLDKSRRNRTTTFISIVLLASMATQVILQIDQYDLGLSTSRYPRSVAEAADRSDIRHLLKSSNILTTGDHIRVGALASVADVYWMHRSFQGVQTNFSSRENLPLVWLVFDKPGTSLECIKHRVGQDVVHIYTAEFALIQISPNSSTSVDNPDSAIQILQSFFTQFDLGEVESGWLPEKCQY